LDFFYLSLVFNQSKMALVICGYIDSLNGYCCKFVPQIIAGDKILFVGNHKSLKNKYDVNHLLVPSVNFVKFPTNIHEHFPNLVVFELSHCKINGTIEREHLKHLTLLRSFIVTDCGLTTLKGDMFNSLRKLEYVSFKNNKIGEVDPDTFNGLALKTLDFRGNKNIDMLYDSRIPTKVTLDDVIKELREKCGRQMAPQLAIEEVIRLRQPVLTESEKMKIELDKKDTLIKNQKEHITNMLAKERIVSNMITSIKTILADAAFKDFTINIGDVCFRVHKFIFAARSPVIADLLRNNPEVDELNLRDIPEATFKAVHDFIYTDKLSAKADHLEVFAAAIRLKIDDLMKAAAVQLLANVNENNCIDVLVLSNKFEHEELRQKAFDVIKTKIFPDRKLKDELAKQPEKLGKLIKTKRKLDRDFEEMMNAVDGEEAAGGSDQL
jgi:hypothetical protein